MRMPLALVWGRRQIVPDALRTWDWLSVLEAWSAWNRSRSAFVRPGRYSCRLGANDEETASTHSSENGGHVVLVDARSGIVALIAPNAGVDVHIMRKDHLHAPSLPLYLVRHPRGEDRTITARAGAALDDDDCRGRGRNVDSRELPGSDAFEESLEISGKVLFPPGERPLCNLLCTVGHRWSILEGVRAEGGEHFLALKQFYRITGHPRVNLPEILLPHTEQKTPPSR